MRIEVTQILSILPRGVFLQWTLRDATESGVYLASVERAGGAEGPWEVILPPTPDQYAVRDALDQAPVSLSYLSPNQLTLMDRLHYRIRVKTPSGRELTYVTDTNGPSPNPSPAAAKMLQHRRHLQLEFTKSLRYLGTQVLLYKRRRWGIRCSRCVDPRTNKVVRSDCRTCWGTGFEGGYWAPYPTEAVRSSLESNVSPTGDKKAEGTSTTILLPTFPTVEPDDVLVCLEDQKRFVMQSQVQPEIRLRGVLQSVGALELSRDHVLFSLNAQPLTVPPLY